MSSWRRLCLLALPILLLAGACNRGEVETPAPLETTASPSPSPTPIAFGMEGTVIEASGSAAGAGGESPGATGTGASPGGTSPTTQTAPSPGEGTEPAPGETASFQNAAPGSLALRLTSFSGSTSGCVFSAGDTVVVSYNTNTGFEPAEVTANERFPNSLERATVTVNGEVLDEEQGCVLVARTITVTQQASPSPTGRATPRATTRRTTPTRTSRPASPSPARPPSPPPSPSPPASPSPAATATATASP